MCASGPTVPPLAVGADGEAHAVGRGVGAPCQRPAARLVVLVLPDVLRARGVPPAHLRHQRPRLPGHERERGRERERERGGRGRQGENERERERGTREAG